MISQEWLCAVAPLGRMVGKDEWFPTGAGIITVCENNAWMITAAHVVHSEESISALVSKKAGGIEAVPLSSLYKKFGIDWVLDSQADLAAGLMPLSPDWDLKVIAERQFIEISEIVPSMPCYTVGCPYGVRGVDPGRSTPLVLGGIVAGTNADAGELFIQAPTFPGNSGGPIIVAKPPYSAQGAVFGGRPTVFLAGIVIRYAITTAPEGINNVPPLHLGYGVSIMKAAALVKSEAAQAMAKKLPV